MTQLEKLGLIMMLLGMYAGITTGNVIVVMVAGFVISGGAGTLLWGGKNDLH